MTVPDPLVSLAVASDPSAAIRLKGGRDDGVHVVLFSGGRGSSVLSQQLIRHPRVKLTIAINGYDDGASTGEVRRFLGDCLGPSDFRKNASRLATELQTADPELVALLDLRLPEGCSPSQGIEAIHLLTGESNTPSSEWLTNLASKASMLKEADRRPFALALSLFEAELGRSAYGFDFSDCALGNIVFAGCFLAVGRNFNLAVAEYCRLLALPNGIILNVTDGTNACLVALDDQNHLLPTEAEIVGGTRRHRISDFFLLDRVPTRSEQEYLSTASPDVIRGFIEQRSVSPPVNPELLERIADADVIIYAPGTQYSSLFPSYIAPGLGDAIGRNLTAIKVLITNLREDAETAEISAVDLMERAVYYLKERNTRPIQTPCLITHYLLNDREHDVDDKPYVPLGRLESLEDPRLVRIGNYEEGSSGYHDASKVLTPFIEAALREEERPRIAVWLLDSQSLNTITQTILEAHRGGLAHLPFEITVFYSDRETLPASFSAALPFAVHNVEAGGVPESDAFLRTIAGGAFDYVILFDSSGMYRGEDIINLASFLTNRRFDAIWGSRRLSVTDIRESYKLRYHHNVVMGAVSYVGSHLLSLAYLLRYGRYVSDTLSSARAVRSSLLLSAGLDLKHPSFNQQLLARLLADRAELIETPVQFFPLAPAKARRTTVWGGLRSLVAAFRKRSGAGMTQTRRASDRPAAAPSTARKSPPSAEGAA